MSFAEVDWWVVVFSLEMAGGAVLLNLIPGVALGWLLARGAWPGKSVVETFVMLPLVMPPVATGLLLLEILGKHGFIGGPLERLGIETVFTWKAVMLAMAVMSFPFVVRSARIAFEGIDPRVEQVAACLGAYPWRVWFTITLPMARRGIVAGLVLAFARSLGEFGATILVAGNIPGSTTTVATSIYSQIMLGKDAEAFALVAISLGFAFLLTLSSEILLRARTP